jgi:NAD(P)-dependent dehydrogenase (short-subunit alcohol dehydrogenase family)
MYNPFSLAGKTILVTGASSGIGKQTAIRISEMGAKLIITGRNSERLNAVLGELKGNEKHFAITANLNSTEEQDQLINKIPNIDGLVLCSGVIKTLPFKFINQDAFADLIKTNLLSPLYLFNLLLRKKKINNSAAVVFISSIGGNLVGTKGNSMYSASKAGLNGAQKVIALELADKKIRVNNVSPGMVRTELWSEGSVSEAQLIEDEKKYPLGYGTTDDVAFGIIYLLSDASKWVTGSSLVMDGGFSIQ